MISVTRTSLPFVSIIGHVGSKSSDKTCLQAPHGVVNLSSSDTMAIALISFFLKPCEKAEKMAFLSAQLVSPNDEFSIFVPIKYWSVFVSTQAPTLKLE